MTRAASPAANRGTNDCISPARIVGLLWAAVLFGAVPRSAPAADGPDATVPEADRAAPDMFAAWQDSVAQARATQPAWSSPLVTTTSLLEQRLRFDVSRQHAGNGADSTVLDGGKGLDLIVNQTTEIQIGAAPYSLR